MKILYHHRIASKDGQYVHVEEIISALKRQGHEVVLVAPQVAENSEFGSDGGFVDTLKAKLPKVLYELAEFSYAFYAFCKLSMAIIKHKPDVIYERYNLFLPAGVWAKKCFKLPFLLEVNAPIFEERQKYDGIALSSLAKWSQAYCWKQADAILPVTDVLADYARAIGVSENRIQVIANGINYARFSDDNIQPTSYYKDNAIVVGFVGFVREWHGLDKVVELIGQFNFDVKLLIVGDGPVKQDLIAQAERLSIADKLHVTGVVEREEMQAWLNVIDIALQPDVTAYASPLKMLEYMAKGKAIVAPDTANIKELLTHNDNALLFDVNNQDDFLQQITLLCENNQLRQSLGQEAKQSVAERGLTWDANASRIVDHFTRLLKQASASDN